VKYLLDANVLREMRLGGLILVTRNVADFRGRKVEVLDPFKSKPRVIEV
jgi:hypothetical protein